MQPVFLASGDTALIVEFGTEVDRKLNAAVMALNRAIRRVGLDGVIETVPTFRSLMIHYDPCHTDHATLRTAVEALLDHAEVVEDAGRSWRIPACYDGELAPDLDVVARKTELETGEVVRLHSEAAFHVYMLGFLPGLPYMAGMSERLAVPRLAEPRVKVPERSVGITGTMSVVYPLVSPGGWSLIARTPVPMFDAGRDPPILFAAGDSVRFEPVGRQEYDRLEAAAARREIPLEDLLEGA